ncbi:MAG: glycosyltransferase [Phycisphaerales bacterium]|jgi:glycosyltransferase involved in cell wall biosynthesis|nr:glycosyltransferase [Phycisphaerales bacterium]
MRAILAIDRERMLDDRPALTAIARGLAEAGIQQTHVIAQSATPSPPLLEDVDVVQVPMPLRWTRRAAELDTAAQALSKSPVDVLFFSGDAASRTARELATRLEVPIACDVWRRDQVESARRTPFVDTWIARSEVLAGGLRDSLQHGTVITARPPIEAGSVARLPDTRPSLVMLDPGGPRKHGAEMIEALASVLSTRPDLEAFLELRGPRAARLWKTADELGILERVTVLERVGMLAQLVGAATIVAAPDPDGPARSLLPTAMCGGAVVVADAHVQDELLVSNETAILLEQPASRPWSEAISGLLSDPGTRQEISHAGALSARAACRPDTALAAWVTALTAAAQPTPHTL